MVSQDGSPALRILLVEDDEINRKVSLAFLQRAGHAVTMVTDGAQAVAAVESRPFDAILMDIRMPVMDGVEATRRIRAMADPGRACVPIIAVTANASPAEVENYEQAGIDAVIAKPLKLGAIEEALAVFFGDSGAESAAAGMVPVLDAERLALLAEAIEPGMLAELLVAARRSIADTLGEMEQHWQAADMAAIGKSAHRIAGVTANFGCVALCELARDIENLCRQGNDGAALRPRLRSLAAATLAALADPFDPAAGTFEH